MSTCRWDREAGEYLADGEPCRVDEYGDPTKHCTARRTCSVHIGRDELTCPRCIARVRASLRRITPLAALMLPVALTAGVNSQAANLAGPAADPAGWSERRIAMRSHLAGWAESGRITEQQHLHARLTMEDDDEQHPANVLGRWCLMIAEDYSHDLPVLTLASATDYLDRNLARIANDPEQDFTLFAAEVRRCRQHLETVVLLAAHKERGAPCPMCVAARQDVRDDLVAREVPEEDWPKLPAVPRLVREYAHWCDSEECRRFHHETDEADRWVCPRDQEHWWAHEDYSRWVEERRGA